MKMMKTLIMLPVLTFFLCCVSGMVQAQNTAKTYVLAVGGIYKDPMEISDQDGFLVQLRDAFAASCPNSLFVLTPPGSSVPNSSGTSSAESVRGAMQSLSGAIQAGDRFIFYYVGQANVVNDDLRLNLPGEDITHRDLSRWLGEMHSATAVVILDCPGAGLAIESLAGPGKIVIASARSDQPYSTIFSRHFIPALTAIEGDGNGDGAISLLEAFQRAAQEIDRLYREQDFLRTENALLEDNGDGVPSQQPWRYEEEDVDGRIAAHYFPLEMRQSP